MPISGGGMKIIKKPLSAKYQYAQIRQEVTKELEGVAQEHVKARERVVSNWQHRPKFKSKVGVGPKQIQILIEVANKNESLGDGKDTTIGDLWMWLDKTGTKAHDIPKAPSTGTGAFMWGGPGSYISKTGANPARYGGPGVVNGGTMHFYSKSGRSLRHPGFPAREFGKAINTDLKHPFDLAVKRGYGRGFKKVTGR